MIDYDALDNIAQAHREWRKNEFWGLSETYVPGEGDNPEAFIFGEAPGADEDVRKRPFVGPAGKVLRQLMALADLRANRERTHESQLGGPDNVNCWLTNVVKFRPPRNATPTPDMLVTTRQLLRDEWEAVGSPRLIIPVGSIALRAITGKPISILRAAGKVYYYASRRTGNGMPVLAIWPMVHPSFVLRQPKGPNREKLEMIIERDWERLGEWRNRAA